MAERAGNAGWIVAAVLAAALVAAMIYVRRHRSTMPQAAPAVATAASVPRSPPSAAEPRYPIANAVGETPAGAVSAAAVVLDDGGVRAALQSLAGGKVPPGWLASGYLIQHIVAAIDALPRRELPPKLLPIRGASGTLVTRVDKDHRITIAAANARRYAPYMRIVDALDADAVATWYARHYAAFQQAYRELGYDQGYFNDRLVQVIDHLLATPQPAAPPALVRPKVRYQFADPELESLSAGQKMLLRVGAADEAKIKAKLRAIRAAVTGVHAPSMTPAAAASAD